MNWLTGLVVNLLFSPDSYLLPTKCKQNSNVSDSRGCKRPRFSVFSFCNVHIPIAFHLLSFLDFSPSSLCCQPCARLMQTWLEFISSKKYQASTETLLGSACGSTTDFLCRLARSLSFSLSASPYQVCWPWLRALWDGRHLSLRFSPTWDHDPDKKLL